MFRQGDVLICKALTPKPKEASTVPRDNKRIILAYGELTGHAHAIEDEEATLWEFGGRRWLITEESVSLNHEEHSTINIPKGEWEVIQQQEYTPAAIRNVAD